MDGLLAWFIALQRPLRDSEPCSWSPRTSEENPSRSKDNMSQTRFFSGIWLRDRRDPVCVTVHCDIWHPMTSYDSMPIETVAWIWVLGVKSPNLIYSFAYFTYIKTLSSSHGTATCICTWCGIRTWWDFLDRFVCQHVNITDLHTLWWDDRVQLYLRSCKYCNRWIWYVLEVLPLPC